MEDEVVFQSNIESWHVVSQSWALATQLSNIDYAAICPANYWFYLVERYHGPDELVQAETPPSIVGAGCMSFWFLQILRQPQGWDSTFCLDTVTGAPLGIPGVI